MKRQRKTSFLILIIIALGSQTIPANACIAVIGNFVWEDLNGDGLQDIGEPGIPGITVELYNCTDVLIESTTTDADGEYYFSHYEAWWGTVRNFYVKFLAPDGYYFTSPNQGSDDEIDSDADPQSGETDCFSIIFKDDLEDFTWDAGLVRTLPSIDIEKYTKGEDISEEIWVCRLDKPQVLTMLYTGDNVLNHNQDPDKVEVTGDPGFAPEVHIIAADKKLQDLHKSKTKIFFNGTVLLGDAFGIDATAAGATRLKANTYVHIFDLEGELLQSIKFHTSCSQPLVLGDEFGGVQLVGFIGEHGATAGLLPP